MAVAVTNIERPTVFGDRRVRIVNLVFSGNYATGGEALSAAALGFSRVDAILFDGPAVAADLATANPVKYDHATGKVAFYESAATGLALLEKTNAEAYPTGSNVRALVIGTF